MGCNSDHLVSMQKLDKFLDPQEFYCKRCDLFFISVLSTLANLLFTQVSALLEDSIARITEAFKSLHVEEESVPLKQSSVKRSEGFENERKAELFPNAG